MAPPRLLPGPHGPTCRPSQQARRSGEPLGQHKAACGWEQTQQHPGLSIPPALSHRRNTHKGGKPVRRHTEQQPFLDLVHFENDLRWLLAQQVLTDTQVAEPKPSPCVLAACWHRGHSPVTDQGREVRGELFVTCGHRWGPGSESGEALARVNTAKALQEERHRASGVIRGRAADPAAPSVLRPSLPRATLLEELARGRSQPDCLSFSEDVGSWAEASSVFRMEAGGSEETCERQESCRWCL